MERAMLRWHRRLGACWQIAKFRMFSITGLALLGLFCLPAQAALFSISGKDLSGELQFANAEKRGLVLYFELPNCTGCREMKLRVFPQPHVERTFGRQFRTVRIDLGRNTALINTDGKSTTSAQLAQRLGVTGTPAFAFFDPQGRLLYRHSGVLLRGAEFIRLGQFVAQAAYDEKPFGEYLRETSGALNARPSPLAQTRGARPRLNFALRDQYGRLRQLADFRGKVVALSVGYTQCPDVCPTTMSEMQRIMAELGTDARRVQVLFATLDPERDKPAMLGAYMAAFHPDFLALRGNPAQTADFVRRFKLVAIKRPLSGYAGYTLDHTAGTFLFDHVGNLRGVSPYGQPTDLLNEDIRTLVFETLGSNKPHKELQTFGRTTSRHDANHESSQTHLSF
jgi:protein SCO1/2